MAKDLQDATLIKPSSIVRVLEGVTVAIKAPPAYVRPFEAWLEEPLGRRNDSPLDVTSGGSTDLAASFSEWHAAVESDPTLREPGVRHVVQVAIAIALLRERSKHQQEVASSALDVIWRLIYEAITRADATELQFTVNRSAQGFLAVPLCSLLKDGRIEELWRFHTWLPDGNRGVSEVGVHAHQTFGQSWILMGCGTDVTFEVDKLDDEKSATHAMYEIGFRSSDGKDSGKSYKTHQLSSTIHNSGKYVRAVPKARISHTRDMSYSVPGGAYHQSIVPGSRLHSTLFVFDASHGYDENAGVLGPKDGDEYTQIRDPEGITARMLADIVNSSRIWEQSNGTTPDDGPEEHPQVTEYYEHFRGLA